MLDYGMLGASTYTPTGLAYAPSTPYLSVQFQPTTGNLISPPPYTIYSQPETVPPVFSNPVTDPFGTFTPQGVTPLTPLLPPTPEQSMQTFDVLDLWTPPGVLQGDTPFTMPPDQPLYGLDIWGGGN